MKLFITHPAKQSLKDIHDYYKDVVGSQSIADKIKTGIVERLKHLRDHPYAGQEEEYLAELGLAHRRLVKDNYKIIYRIAEDTIYVTDIFDSRQDPSKMKA